MAERFSVGLRRFFAALLGGTQEKATINRRKMACQRAMFSYEDGANPDAFIYLENGLPRAARSQ